MRSEDKQFLDAECQMQTTYNMSGKVFDKYENAMSYIIESFHKSIEPGPEYICSCCDQLWFESSVNKCSSNLCRSCPDSICNMCMTGVKSVDNVKWICRTCQEALRHGKLPVCAKANFMTFPTKPDLLNLTELEERLISPRIPFMQIRELPRGGQLSIHGNVVNVPADVNSTVNLLPRSVSESETIPVKLKRRLDYKHHYQFQSIRPKKVLQAVEYLVRTSKLFQDEGIQINDGWMDSLNTIENPDLAEFYTPRQRAENEDGEIENKQHDPIWSNGCVIARARS